MEEINTDTIVEENNTTAQMPPKPDNNLILAVFTTICCCLPLGIVAIIKASSVNTLYVVGNYQGAVMAAAESKKWSTWGIVGGLIIDFIYIAINVFVALNGMTD